METKQAYELEVKLWEAAKNRSRQDFLKVVSKDAVMVCGGFRCSGLEYADVISVFDCKSYAIEHFEVVSEDAGSVQVHYVLRMEVSDQQNADLAGVFHITTTWKNLGGRWKVVFNMDQRIME